MNWSRVSCLFIAAAAIMPAGPGFAADPTATLTIHVQDLRAEGGILRLGVYDAARYPDDKSVPVASADVPASGFETVITLHGIAPGTYAIETFQDINANDKMDTTWLGIPLEPFGFSRDARPFLSKPDFGDVKFTLVAGENTQIIHLQNFTGTSPTEQARDALRARQRK